MRLTLLRLALLSVVLIPIAACGGDSQSSSEEAQAEFCDDLDTFVGTVRQMGSDIVNLDLNSAKQRVDDARAQFEDLKVSARRVGEENSTQLESDFDAFRTSLDSIGETNSVRGELEQVQTDLATLLGDLGYLASQYRCD